MSFSFSGLFALALAVGGPVPGDVLLTVHTGACDGPGLSGTLRRGDLSVRFLTCPGETSCRTSIATGDGDPLTEVVHDGETLTLRIAGIDVGDPDALTADDLAAVEAVTAMPEYELAAGLWDRLVRTGLDPGSPAMACLNLQMQAYERERTLALEGQPCDRDCHDTSQDCLGCCGVGCTSALGCATACTASCLEHDLCFRAGPSTRFSRSCLRALVRAATSALACTMRHRGFGTCCDL